MLVCMRSFFRCIHPYITFAKKSYFYTPSVYFLDPIPVCTYKVAFLTPTMFEKFLFSHSQTTYGPLKLSQLRKAKFVYMYTFSWGLDPAPHANLIYGRSLNLFSYWAVGIEQKVRCYLVNLNRLALQSNVVQFCHTSLVIAESKYSFFFQFPHRAFDHFERHYINSYYLYCC